MSDKEEKSRNIPKLDDSNFPAWSMRIKAHLQNKELLNTCLYPLDESLTGVVLTAHKKKGNAAVDILMNYMGDAAFDNIVTTEIEENPHLIWSKIIQRYASQSVNNKGWIWLKFMRYEFNGNLKEYIAECTKMINEIAIVQLGVPDEVLCYSILAKLSKNLWNVVDNIIMNKKLVKHPDITLAKLQEMVYLEESRSKKDDAQKISGSDSTGNATVLLKETKNQKPPFRRFQDPTRLCENGKHNPRSYHPEDKCFELHPHLKSGTAAATHIATASTLEGEEAELLLTTGSLKPTVLDSGATHHMINDPSLFTSLTPCNAKISTGNQSNSLFAKGRGCVVLRNQSGQLMVLEDTLLVPDLNRSLISLCPIFKKSLLVTRDENNRAEVTVDNSFVITGVLHQNLLELDEGLFKAMNNVSC